MLNYKDPSLFLSNFKPSKVFSPCNSLFIFV
nr:MAG TPA: hypothetical protein [Caudoviricetes sp.]